MFGFGGGFPCCGCGFPCCGCGFGGGSWIWIIIVIFIIFCLCCNNDRRFDDRR